MENSEIGLQPIFLHVEPVLAVQDISETVSYWQDILGFPQKWTWGEPPNHGGVSWQKVFIQFSKNQELATVSKGNSIWIRIQHIDTLYSFHQMKNAEIVSPLENRPWGMAEYIVREINGYYLCFSSPASEREQSAASLPASIRIIERTPTVKEFRNLATAVGWSASTNEEIGERSLAAALFAVVAEDTMKGEIVGSALLLGDHATFYYIKDVMVHPDWQGKRIGTALMQALNDWLEKNAINNALVALISGEALEPFYQQFGFAKAFSMIRYIHRNEKEG